MVRETAPFLFLMKLEELRKNPQKNIKLSIVDYLRPYKDMDDAFVRFVDLPKLGVNPKYSWDTPLGYYAYPIKTLWSQIEKDTIPFQGDAKYAVAFKVKDYSNILDVAKYNENDLSKDIQKIVKFVEQRTTNINIHMLMDRWISSARPKNIVASSIWNITKNLSDQIQINKDGRRTAMLWTEILRKVLGYTGVVDMSHGLIHGNEPTQAVFFDIRVLNNGKVFDNKRPSGKEYITNKRKEFFDLFNNSTFEQKLELVKKLPDYDLRRTDVKYLNFSEKEIIYMAKSDSESNHRIVFYSKNPSDEALETAYEKLPKSSVALSQHDASRIIIKRGIGSKNLRDKILSKHPDSLELIDNPTMKEILIAIKAYDKNPHYQGLRGVIEVIYLLKDKKHEEFQYYVLEHYPEVLGSFDELTDEVFSKMIDEKPEVLKTFSGHDKHVKDHILNDKLRQRPELIKYLKHPSNKQMEIVIRANPELYDSISVYEYIPWELQQLYKELTGKEPPTEEERRVGNKTPKDMPF